MSKASRKFSVLALCGFLIVFLCVIIFYPQGKKEALPTGFTPIRDDALAARYLPGFDCPPEFGPIIALYYRASQDQSGRILIAYHPVWAKERNDTKAWGPLLSRWLYTGGLSLQKAMFGIGDIESVGMAIDSVSGDILEVEYETAADYSPASFSVRHRKIFEKGPFSTPLFFKVVSWNHLFNLETNPLNAPIAQPSPTAPGAQTTAPLSYFTPELWKKYAMWKNPETILRKNRAHFVWERASIMDALDARK